MHAEVKQKDINGFILFHDYLFLITILSTRSRLLRNQILEVKYWKL